MWVFWLGLNLYLAQPEQESKINFVCIFFLLCFQGQPGVMGMEGQPGLPGYSVSSSVFYPSTFSWAFYQPQIIAIIYSIYRRSVLRKVGWSWRKSDSSVRTAAGISYTHHRGGQEQEQELVQAAELEPPCLCLCVKALTLIHTCLRLLAGF